MVTHNSINVLMFAGSLRRESFNRKALQIAKNIVTELGANVIELDLKTLDLPVFNADLREDRFPDSVVKLKDEIEKADVLIIATPEYNHSIPGPLKNAIDWASDQTNPFEGKIAAIFGASIGLYGTLRAQLHLRQVLTALNVDVIPQPQVFIRSAKKAFQSDGSLADQQITKQLRLLIERTLILAQHRKHMMNL